MALRLFGIDIGPAVAGLGVVGIAVGLGAQTVVRDWLAGIFIVLENQYSQGDVVRIAGVDGVVEDFSLRRTTLRDMDGAVHTVPNGQIIVTSNVTRVRTPVTIELGSPAVPTSTAPREIVDRIGQDLKADPAWRARIVEPPRLVNVEEAGSSATLTVTGQVRAAEQLAVGEELRSRIVAAFADAGIEIPFPHRVEVNRTETRAAEKDASGA